MNDLNRLPHFFADVLRHLGRGRVAAIAAASAFWIFLSLVPLAILLFALLPYTPVTEALLLEMLERYVPESFQALLQGILRDVYKSSPALLSVSLLTTLWSAAKGFSALIHGLEEIYEQPERSGFLRRRIRGALYTVVFIASLLLSILLLGFGRTLLLALGRHFPWLHGLFRFLLRLRFAVMPLMLLLFFALLYRWAPGLELAFSGQLPGAVFASLGWLLFSGAFSLWLRFTDGYGTYGSLATVAVALVWLYYCMEILLWGACLNKALARLRRA